METHKFLNTKSLEIGITNRKKLTNGEKVSWLKTCWIKLGKGSPRSFQMKQTHLESDTFMLLDVTKRNRGQPSTTINVELEPLYPNGRKLTREKLSDLFELIQFIPPVHHPYYLALKGDEEATDLGLTDDSGDKGIN